jgi:hypothetical protein
MNQLPIPFQKFEDAHLPGLGPDDEIVTEKHPVEPIPTESEPMSDEDRELERQDGHAQRNFYTIRSSAQQSGEIATTNTVELGSVKPTKATQPGAGRRRKGATGRAAGETTAAQGGSWSNWN